MFSYEIGKFPCELSGILSLNEPNCVSQRTVTYKSDGHSVACPRWGDSLHYFNSLVKYMKIMHEECSAFD
jgi:hypothetical protein